MRLRGALTELEEAGQSAGELLSRHAAGDWGDLSDADRKENEFSLLNGFRLLSSYRLRSGAKLWIISESDRASTCLLLPEEY